MSYHLSLSQLFFVFSTFAYSLLPAQPLLTSWYTSDSTRYARIYPTYEDEQAQNAVTTWDNGTYAQSVPAYSGISQIHYSNDFVYLKTNGLSAGHVMGPWYNNTGPGGSIEVFQNWPESIDNIYVLPRFPSIPSVKSAFPPGAIGLMIDGTIIFSSSDTFSYDGSTGSDTGPELRGTGNGSGVWNHDAYITESNTFDKSNAHAAGNQLHYHASPMKLRYLLGDSVTAAQQPDGSFLYSEAFNGQHSPIIGWLNDGLPLYGPYGYDDPSINSTDTSVRRMVSGFVVRDGQLGTYDIPSNGRNSLPDWAVRFQGIGPAVSGDNAGPDVSEIPLPYFMEDYAYLGDLINPVDHQPYEQYVDYDLNEYNVRFCRTPEFPEGTWAYFTCIDENGDVTFPYNVAAQYYGDPGNGGTTNFINEEVTTYFLGGADALESAKSITPNQSSGDIVILWNVLEGGTYTIQSSSDLQSWTELESSQLATDSTLESTDLAALNQPQNNYYQIIRTSLADFDGANATGSGNANFSATFSEMIPPSADPITSVTVGGITGTLTSYDANSATITINFDDSSLSPGSYTATMSFAPPPDIGGNHFTVTSTNSYLVP